MYSEIASNKRRSLVLIALFIVLIAGLGYVIDLYFVGGFGVMGWVAASDYAAAEPDPLAESAEGIIRHMNADHEAAMLDIAKHVKSITATEAKMTSVDRLGFSVRLKTPERVRSVRIGFPSEVKTAGECRKTLVAMVKEARSVSK